MVKHSLLCSATRSWRFSCVGALVCALLLCGSDLRAQVIVDSHGFESPYFTTTFNGTGELQGQPPASSETWMISGSGSTATVQTSVVQAGSQAVRVNRSANSDVRWADPVSGFPSGGNTFITIQWHMRVEQTLGSPETFGPFFGMEAYDDVGTLGVLGSLGVDATTGDLLYQAADTGFFTETGTLVPFGTWHQYMVELNYTTHQYRIFFDGAPLGTIGFVDQNNVVGGLNDFSDADIAAVTGAGDPGSLALTGIAYFDNFTVFQGPVPEPAGALTAGLAALVLCARRRDHH